MNLAKIIPDLAKLGAFPHAARADLWGLLGPSLGEVIPDRISSEIVGFAEAHGVDPVDVAHVLKAWRATLRTAIRDGVVASELVAQLERELEGASWIEPFLRAGFEPATEQLGREAASLTTFDHGPVLVGSRWRVDMVTASDRGAPHASSSHIGFVTLRYRDAAGDRTISLQTTPAELDELLQNLTLLRAALRENR